MDRMRLMNYLLKTTHIDEFNMFNNPSQTGDRYNDLLLQHVLWFLYAAWLLASAA